MPRKKKNPDAATTAVIASPAQPFPRASVEVRGPPGQGGRGSGRGRGSLMGRGGGIPGRGRGRATGRGGSAYAPSTAGGSGAKKSLLDDEAEGGDDSGGFGFNAT